MLIADVDGCARSRARRRKVSRAGARQARLLIELK
jgi:hypothetical protein